MPDQQDISTQAPINPVAALTLVIAFPGRTFERLRERPHWVLPLVFVILCSIIGGMYPVVGGQLDSFLENAALRSGREPEVTRTAFLAWIFISSVGVVPLMFLLEALFYRLAGSLRGGRARYSVVFSTVAYASVPMGIGALVGAGLVRFTGSPSAGANLAFLVDPMRQPVLWSIARHMDVFQLWFLLLLGIAARHVFRLRPARAAQAGLLFAAFYLLVAIVSSVGNAGQFADPYEAWTTATVGDVVIHHGPELQTNAAAAQLADAKTRLPEALRTAEESVGLPHIPRIDVYLYPSLDAKLAVTGNHALAHAVEWANAVHVAWVNGAEAAFTTAAVRVSAAGSLGTVYNPFLADGLAVAASGASEATEDGASAMGAASVSLEELLDPVEYRRAEGDGVPVSALAGAFARFVMDTRGAETLHDILRRQGDAAGPAVTAVEDALSLPISEIETQWTEHLRDRVSGSAEET